MHDLVRVFVIQKVRDTRIESEVKDIRLARELPISSSYLLWRENEESVKIPEGNRRSDSASL